MVSTMTNVEAMKVPEGYKQTEVGVIPEDWDVKRMGDVFSILSGVSFSGEFFSNKGPILLTPGNFRLAGGLYFEERNTKRYSGSYTKNAVFEKGDLLIVMTDLTSDCNLLGKPAFIESDELILHNQRIGKLININNKCSRNFIYYSLLAPIYLSYIKETATGSTVRHTSNKSILTAPVILPSSKEEQTAIANALSDVDKLIAALETLIAKKSAIKTAAMQQLLTGKKRLPAFAGEREGQHLKANEQCNAKPNEQHRTQPNSASDTPAQHHSDAENSHHQHTPRPGYKQTELGEIPEDWEVVFLGDYSIISRLAGAEYTSVWKEDPTGEITALRGFNIGKNKIIERDLTRISNSLSMQLKRSRLTKGDVVYPCVGSIGNAVVITEDDKYHIQQNIARISPEKHRLCSEYLAHYLMSEIAFREVERSTATTSQPSVLVSSLREYRVPLPCSYQEQLSISEFLTAMDTELDALQQRLNKTQKIKQGMMQELLTGKTRLV